jgi:hypothetical protein
MGDDPEISASDWLEVRESFRDELLRTEAHVAFLRNERLPEIARELTKQCAIEGHILGDSVVADPPYHLIQKCRRCDFNVVSDNPDFNNLTGLQQRRVRKSF